MDLKSLGTLNPGGTLNQPKEPAATTPSQLPPGATLNLGAAPNVGAPAKGIEAYVQLLTSLVADELHEKNAGLLTTGLRAASASLRTAYTEVTARLPADLAAKDWKFSVSDGGLVFSASQDELSVQDLATLRTIFTSSNVGPAAKQVAAMIISIVQMRKAGADPGSLAWVRFDVDDTNFGDRIDLRSYVTATAPGSLYHPNPVQASQLQQQVPPMLGGLDLREMVTARPRFLRADGTVSPEAVEEFDVIPEAPEASSTLHGQCSCGQVRFIVNDEFEYAFYCHCSRCRARTGSVFAAIAGVSVEKLAVIAGHEHLLLEGECSDGYGARCSRCYSFLFAAVRARKYLHVSLGVLVDEPSRVPDHHIYVGSKAAWYQITDLLPQYEELPTH
jgi:hypothetical protein